MAVYSFYRYLAYASEKGTVRTKREDWPSCSY
jgi:hypothetical protein